MSNSLESAIEIFLDGVEKALLSQKKDGSFKEGKGQKDGMLKSVLVKFQQITNLAPYEIPLEEDRFKLYADLIDYAHFSIRSSLVIEWPGVYPIEGIDNEEDLKLNTWYKEGSLSWAAHRLYRDFYKRYPVNYNRAVPVEEKAWDTTEKDQ